MNDLRDWVVLVLVTAALIAATVFLFLVLFLKGEGAVATFGIWSGVCTTITTAYHWLCIHDDKHPDAP